MHRLMPLEPLESRLGRGVFHARKLQLPGVTNQRPERPGDLGAVTAEVTANGITFLRSITRSGGSCLESGVIDVACGGAR